jgi:hypothetical protein
MASAVGKIDPKRWWASLPPFTKLMLACQVGVSVVCFSGFVPPLIGLLPPFSLFLHQPSLMFLLHLYLFQRYAALVETTVLEGDAVDKLWFYLLSGGLITAVATLLGLSPAACLSPMMMFVYCRANHSAKVRLPFDIDLKAIYVPLFWWGVDVLMGAKGGANVVGMAVGHTYTYTKLVRADDFRALYAAPKRMRAFFDKRAKKSLGDGPLPANW